MVRIALFHKYCLELQFYAHFVIIYPADVFRTLLLASYSMYALWF